nr:TOBE domain-containing protein [Mesorhizobium sp.]
MRSPFTTPDSANLCIRPENIELLDVSTTSSGDLEGNVLPGVVLDVAPLGADVHVVVELSEKSRLLVIQKNIGTGSEFVAGQPVLARFSVASVLAF